MAFEHREGSGYIFWKTPANEKAPCERGELLINGVLHEVAVWPEREGKKGRFFKVAPKQDKPQETRKPVLPDDKEDDSSIPF